MTKKELSEYRQYGREIRLYEEERGQLRRMERHQSNAAQVVKGSLPEFPYTVHSVLVEGENIDATERQVEIAELTRKIEALQNRRAAIRIFVETIPDSELRQIFMLRYLQGLSWEAAARKMGAGYTADAIRIRIGRFFNK